MIQRSHFQMTGRQVSCPILPSSARTRTDDFTNSCGCASLQAWLESVCVLPSAEDRQRLLAIAADRNRPLKHVLRGERDVTAASHYAAIACEPALVHF